MKTFSFQPGVQQSKKVRLTEKIQAIASMTHCALNQDGLIAMEAHITRFNAVANEV